MKMRDAQSEPLFCQQGSNIKLLSSSSLPTKHGIFQIHVYGNDDSSTEHVALVKGDVYGTSHTLVRVHSECMTGDVFGSVRCDCGEQLEAAMAAIARSGQGVIIYLRGHEGRGIGIKNKVLAYALQDEGYDTVDANVELGLPVDSRDFSAAAHIILSLGIKSIALMTNNLDKVAQLRKIGVDVAARIASHVPLNAHNTSYLLTKQKRLGHMLALSALNDNEKALSEEHTISRCMS